MNIRIPRGFVFFALLIASMPCLAQTTRLIWQGPAYAYVEDQLITESVIDQIIGAPVGEGAQVVFFRPVDAAPNDASLREGDMPLAQLPRGVYYAIAVAPGVHTYTVDGSPLQVQVGQGDRRYVRISNRRATLEPVPSNAMTFLRVTTGKRSIFY
jgi:hypothetical protein